MAEFGEVLSERELDVLRCVVRGASNKDISVELFISQNTVKVHLRNIFVKLGVASRAEAVTVALQRGLVALPGGTAVLPPPPDEPEDVLPVPAVQPNPSEVIPVVLPEKTADSPPTRRSNSTLLLTAVSLLVLLLLIGYWSIQTSNNLPTPSPTPFQDIPVAGDDRWAQTQPLPQPRAAMAVATVGLNVYFIGGETETGVSGDVWVYTPSQKTWLPLAEKPTAVADATATVLFGEIYVAGGRLASGEPTELVEVYSPTNNAWRQVQSLPQPISGSTTLTDGSFLFLFGGWNSETYLDTTYVYDLGGDSWRPLPSMSQPRAFTTGGLLTGSFFVVGGYDGVNELTSCETFDPTAETWQPCPPTSIPHAGAGSVVLLNKLYVIGGGWQEQNEISYSESYDPNTETWQIVNTPMLATIPNWTQMGVAQIETQIFATGGRRDGELTADNFVFTAIYQTYLPTFGNDTEP